MKRAFPYKSFLFLSIVLSILTHCLVLGQFPRLNFKSFTEKDGLSKDYVRTIFQDRDGFMWFGTPDGIDKFDGKSFTNYNNLFKDSLSSNYQITYNIIEDNDGVLWIATYSNGIILFDKNIETIKRLKHSDNDPGSISDDRVIKIFKDKDSNIWVATAGGGLDFWQKDHQNFIHFKHNPQNQNSIGSNYASSIASDSKGNLWVLSLDGYISQYDRKTGKFSNYTLPLSSHNATLRRGLTPFIYVDSDDNVLAGSHYGLYILNPHTGDIKYHAQLNPHYKEAFIVTSILEIQKGIIALTTSFQGMYLLNTKTGEYINYSNNINANYFLNNNAITCIYKSKDGLLWLGSYYGGVNMYNKEFSQFQILNELAKSANNNLIGKRGAAFCSSPDSQIWIATGDEEIMAYDPKNRSAHQVLQNVAKSTIHSLFSNKKGEIFIGTASNGLIVYDFWKNTYKTLTNNPEDPNSIASDYVYCVLEDKDNRIWMSFTGTGLDIWDRSINKIKHFKHDANNPNSLLSDVIYRMIEDRSGRVWIGTQSGLCYFDKDKQHFIPYPLYIDEKNKVTVNTILDIFEDSKGDIWVGTNKALFKLNPKKLSSTVFLSKHELPYLITNIMEDPDHNLWMTSYNKLFKFNTTNCDFTVYGLYNGYSNPSFMGFSSLSANGQFYLGSLDRIITFNPKHIVEEISKPKIFITNFEINNTPVVYQSSKALTGHINHAKSINLDYQQSTFSFVFAAIEYSFPEKIQYAYKLENFDKNWIYSGSLNRAAYTKVPAGKYIFRVKATNRKGEWFESDQKINITITPPFWKTLGFRLFALFLSLAFISAIYSIRDRQLRLQKKKLEETIKERTRDLNEANTSLEEQHEEVQQQNDLLSQMSQQIMRQNKELEMHYNKLERLVDERTKELKEAKNKAEESDNLKSAFLANMSHEIRTPMNAIVGFSTLLKDGNLTMEKKDEYIEIINKNSDSLLILIDDILDLSMIEAGQLVIRNEIINVNEFLDHLFSTYSLLNRKGKVKFIFNNELHNQNIQILSDKIRFKQILSNLISNSFKFTHSGMVELGSKMIDNNLAFYVKDTGIGIPEKDIEAIFERFRKSEDDKDIFFRGAGLGLTISNALTQLLGGNLTVESKLGSGSIFTLLLPDTVISNEKPLVSEIPVLFDSGSIANKNVLVVEDEIANYKYMEALLAKPYIKVFHAENGLEALKMLESENHFHLILMDLKMPEMDGYEATRIIKSKNPDQLVVAVTAYAREEEKTKFMEAGFNEYLTKPVKPSDLMAVIHKYFK